MENIEHMRKYAKSGETPEKLDLLMAIAPTLVYKHRPCLSQNKFIEVFKSDAPLISYDLFWVFENQHVRTNLLILVKTKNAHLTKTLLENVRFAFNRSPEATLNLFGRMSEEWPMREIDEKKNIKKNTDFTKKFQAIETHQIVILLKALKITEDTIIEYVINYRCASGAELEYFMKMGQQEPRPNCQRWDEKTLAKKVRAYTKTGKL
ncbi:unnamed protein product [Caenorhabditis angaria]|uniref:Uncharacterized protein n=1 Tax=Caenorhabditis angaria TaxID=860376 RepID=A0A9P1MYG6_9PELO|nr:unnamed protein product [Caenorhabditis angaria]